MTLRETGRPGTSLADHFLRVLRDRLAQPDLAYREPPERLGGGYFTENHAFRLETTVAAWNRPLVLRLFPNQAPGDLPRREAAAQTVVADQGLAAPRVLLCEEGTDELGRSFLVMERLPGVPLMGGVETGGVARSGARLLLRFPDLLAQIQAELHGLDPAPLVETLGDLPAGVDRWLGFLDDHVAERSPELASALAWLVAHRPPDPPRPAICHGDLWPGNLLVDGRRVTGVLDWTLATVADPAFDVGFSAMALAIAPVDAPRAVQKVALWFSRRMARRFVAAYRDLTSADLSAVPWYEALRCVLELTEVIDYRRSHAQNRHRDAPRPTWDRATDRVIEYFRARTGVTIALPPPVTAR